MSKKRSNTDPSKNKTQKTKKRSNTDPTKNIFIDLIMGDIENGFTSEQYNGQMKQDKRRNNDLQKITHKTKD
jgi:hypothetical protein